MRRIVFILAGALIAAGCSHPAASQAQSMFGGLPIDGIQCNQSEGAVEHIHTHVQLFEHGHAVTIPANVGIPLGGTCLYWIHTHAADGIVHIESPVKRAFTLGQFFDIWGMDLSATKAASLVAPRGRRLTITVNGAIWKGNPNAIPLRDHEEIVIQNGPPFGKPTHVDWTKM